MNRVFSIGVLAVLTIGLYSAGVDTTAVQPEECLLLTQATTLVDRHGRDAQGRFIPVFLEDAGGTWLPPIPVYAAAIALKLRPSPGTTVRWVAIAAGVLSMLLTWEIANQLFRNDLLAGCAALLVMVTPAHLALSRVARQDGVWPLPFIELWVLTLIRFMKMPSLHGNAWLAVGAAALAASVYTQPSAALMVPPFAVVGLVALRAADSLRWREVGPACAAFFVVLLPLLFWFSVHPRTYMETLGRWALHPAYLRNPVEFLRAYTNWGTLGTICATFWDFFSPSHLAINGSAPGWSGAFLAPVAVLIVFGAIEILRTAPGGGTRGTIALVVLAAFAIAPLAAATFKEPRAIQRALVIVPFGALVATYGLEALKNRASPVSRALMLLLLAAIPLQFVIWYNGFLRLNH